MIDRQFVSYWAGKYDARMSRPNRRFPAGSVIAEEAALRQWLADLPEPKFLDKEHFVRIAMWKSPRPKPHYESNEESHIKDVTRQAYLATYEEEKLKILCDDDDLHGVRIPVASTILYFMFPNNFPIFDIRVRTALAEANKWSRPVKDAGVDAWKQYVVLMRQLTAQLGVELRALDKALWEYTK